MPPEEFAVLVGCPKGKGCQAWCRDGDRAQFNVILGAEMAITVLRNVDEVYGKAKLEKVLGEWRAFGEAPKKRGRRPPRNRDPEAPTIRDQTAAGRKAAKTQAARNRETRGALTLLTLGDSKQELTDRIDAVTTALAAVPEARARKIADLEKANREIDADEADIRANEELIAYLLRRGAVADSAEDMRSRATPTHWLLSTQVADLEELLPLVQKNCRGVHLETIVRLACRQAKSAFAADVKEDPSKRHSDILRLLDVFEQMTRSPPTPDAELQRLAPLEARLIDAGAFEKLCFDADGKPRRATKEELGLLFELLAARCRRGVRIRQFLALRHEDIPFGSPEARRLLVQLQKRVRHAVDHEGLSVEKPLFLLKTEAAGGTIDEDLGWSDPIVPLVREAAPELGDAVGAVIAVHDKIARLSGGPALNGGASLYRDAAAHVRSATLRRSSLLHGEAVQRKSGNVMSHADDLAKRGEEFGVDPDTGVRWAWPHQNGRGEPIDVDKEQRPAEGIRYNGSVQISADCSKHELAGIGWLTLTDSETQLGSSARVHTSFSREAASCIDDCGLAALDPALAPRDCRAFEDMKICGPNSPWVGCLMVLLDRSALDRCFFYHRGVLDWIICWPLLLDTFRCPAFESGAMAATRNLPPEDRCAPKVPEFLQRWWLKKVHKHLLGILVRDALSMRETGPDGEATDLEFVPCEGLPCLVEALVNHGRVDVEAKNNDEGGLESRIGQGNTDWSQGGDHVKIKKKRSSFHSQLVMYCSTVNSDDKMMPFCIASSRRTCRTLQKVALDIHGGSDAATVLHEMHQAEPAFSELQLHIVPVCALNVVETVSFVGPLDTVKKNFAAALNRSLDLAFAHAEMHGRIDPERYYAPYVPPSPIEKRSVFDAVAEADGSCTCDEIATALLDSMTLERVGVVADALARDGGRHSRLVKLDGDRFAVRRNATEPPLATAAFPDDDAWADWRGCICGSGAYGEMVACDGGCDNWFHLACVGLASAPRGEYICDACAGTVAEPRLSPWDPSLIPKAVDEATQVALEEKARSGFDESDAEEDEPKRKPSVRSPQPSREDCHAAAQANVSPTVGLSEKLESPTVARAKDRKLEAKEVDENEDLMRDENEPPPPPRRSRVRDPLPPQGQN